MRLGRDRAAGMTLVEVLVASTMGALLLMGLAAAAGNVFHAFSTGKTEMTQNRELALSLDTIFDTVRTSADAWSGGPSTLVLEDPAGTDTFCTWSGSAGDPLTMQVEGQAVHDLIEGVKNFTFTINQSQVTRESVASANQQTLFFDFFPAGFQEWWVLTIDRKDRYGVEFVIPSSGGVDVIRLTQLMVRLGDTWDCWDDVRIRLYETRAPHIPRPVGPSLAVVDVPHGDLPWAPDPWSNIAWLTVNLPQDFTIYPNRHYILLFYSVNDGEAGVLRFRRHDDYYDDNQPPLGPGSHRLIRMLVSHDYGSTYNPSLGSHEMDFEDIPVQLFGDVISISMGQVQVMRSVDLFLEVERNGGALSLKRREHLSGGIK